MGTVQALSTIVEAAKILRDYDSIKFIMVGSGSRVEWLKSEIKKNNLSNIELPGRFPLYLMPAIMGGASALLVSLIKNPIISQTIPSKLQAYLAAGKPIIASLDGEGSRILHDAKAGVSVPAEDASALAGAILYLKSLSKVDLDEMGRNARSYYDNNFEPRLLGQKLMQLLSDTQGRKL